MTIRIYLTDKKTPEEAKKDVKKVIVIKGKNEHNF